MASEQCAVDFLIVATVSSRLVSFSRPGPVSHLTWTLLLRSSRLWHSRLAARFMPVSLSLSECRSYQFLVARFHFK